MRYVIILLFPLFIWSTETTPSSETGQDEFEQQTETLSSPLSATHYQKQFYKTFAFLFIFVLLAILLILLSKKITKDRAFQINQKKNIKILERRQISPQTFLYHIEIGNKQIIISESKYEVRPLTTMEWEENR